MPTRLIQSVGQLSLEYRPTFHFRVKGAYYQLTDEAVLIYRRNGIDFWEAAEHPEYYEAAKNICFKHGTPVAESLWMDKAAWVVEKIKRLTSKN